MQVRKEVGGWFAGVRFVFAYPRAVSVSSVREASSKAPRRDMTCGTIACTSPMFSGKLSHAIIKAKVTRQLPSEEASVTNIPGGGPAVDMDKRHTKRINGPKTPPHQKQSPKKKEERKWVPWVDVEDLGDKVGSTVKDLPRLRACRTDPEGVVQHLVAHQVGGRRVAEVVDPALHAQEHAVLGWKRGEGVRQWRLDGDEERRARLDYEPAAIHMLSLYGWMHWLAGPKTCVDAPAVPRWRRRPCPCC